MSQSDRPSLAIWPANNTDQRMVTTGWLSLLFALALARAAARDAAGGGDGSSIPAETVAGVFVCLGRIIFAAVAYHEGWRRFFPPDVLSNLATRYHRAGG